MQIYLFSCVINPASQLRNDSKFKSCALKFGGACLHLHKRSCSHQVLFKWQTRALPHLPHKLCIQLLYIFTWAINVTDNISMHPLFCMQTQNFKLARFADKSRIQGRFWKDLPQKCYVLWHICQMFVRAPFCWRHSVPGEILEKLDP